MAEYFWQNILNSRQIVADTLEKLANQGEVLQGVIKHIYLSLSNKLKPCTEPSKVGHLISERSYKITLDFTETASNYLLKRGSTVLKKCGTS